ncbi:MAG TPA: response regulator, partial [Calditrichia bacterium]|nr:response regulator [Calditrichia bacterium]
MDNTFWSKKSGVFSRLKIRQKILLIPGLVSAFFIILAVTNFVVQKEVATQLESVKTGHVPAMQASQEMKNLLDNIQYALQNAATTQDEFEITISDSLTRVFASILDSSRANPTFEPAFLDSLQTNFTAYRRLAKATTQRMISEDFGEDLVRDLEEMRQRFNWIKSSLDNRSVDSRQEAYQALEQTQATYNRSFYNVLFLVLTVALLVIFISLYISKGIDQSLQQVVNVADEMATGNTEVSLRINTQDEFGFLAKSFNQLISATKDLTAAATAIGQGNYEVPVRVRGERDILGNALDMMRENLVRISRENAGQNWLKTGQAELNDRMRGENDLISLTQRVLNFLASYLNCQVGAIYVADENNVLKMTASFALTRRKNLSNSFELGEGVVGQAALEQRTILLEAVPENYLSVTSGTGSATPTNILVTPLLYDGTLNGVIELGAFKPFNQQDLLFLEQAANSIAISFNSAKASIQLKNLLDATRNQTEELRRQQSDLKEANERLENQTSALQESEKRLQAQQDQLQRSNIELEEQTEALEMQKDILRQKNLELEDAQALVQEKANDLELANKYKSEFLANMSHELRTPLNSMLILSKMLATNRDGNLSDDQVRFMETIHQSGADLLRLINDILDLSKVEAGKLEILVESVRLSDTERMMRHQFQHVAEDKNLEFHVDLSDELDDEITTDSTRLNQILKNLLSNAFKFTEKGSVTLSITPFDRSFALRNETLDPEQAVAFEVRDTGIGIPPEKQKVIFEAFQQADGTISRRFGGTGLGLSISRELARLLGGEIHLESSDQGSAFTLLLPRKNAQKIPVIKTSTRVENGTPQAHEPSPAPRAAARVRREAASPAVAEVAGVNSPGSAFHPVDDREGIQSGDKVILIVEDDANFATVLSELVRERGFKALTALDGEEGLSLASRFAPMGIPAGIILDIGLPKRSGWSVLEALKENPQTRHIPVHIISGAEDSQDAVRYGAIGVLKKPVVTEQIADILAHIQKIGDRDKKRLLVVEDNQIERESIVHLIDAGDVEIQAVGSGTEALQKLRDTEFDSVVIDLGLGDMSGFELLESIGELSIPNKPPIIIHTGRDLSKEEEQELRMHAASIIIKGENSVERLLGETSIFLHRVDAEMPDNQRKILKAIHNKERIFQSKNVLVVDDDLRNTFALSHALEERGIKISIAKNGRDAVDKLKANPHFDLVLMDIMMPVMNGYEAMSAIRGELALKRLPIIALTANAMKG